jgi:hypothetical protein
MHPDPHALKPQVRHRSKQLIRFRVVLGQMLGLRVELGQVVGF